MKKWLSPCGPPARGPAPLRVSSPPSGFSILITSAPMSDRIWLASGPAITRVKSITRMPLSGGRPEEDMEARLARLAAAKGRERRLMRARLRRESRSAGVGLAQDQHRQDRQKDHTTQGPEAVAVGHDRGVEPDLLGDDVVGALGRRGEI